ncbi:MAG: DNA recombination protein RmuC [Rhodobacterales bacterium]|nr:DNA recombination protein RmuC [Rhodobacterales bacterium]
MDLSRLAADPLLQALAAALVVAVGLLAVLWARLSAGRQQAETLRTERDEAHGALHEARAEAAERIAAMTAETARADTRRQETERALDRLSAERDGAEAARQAAERAREAAQRRADLSDQARAETDKRMADWETARQQSLEAAKASVLKTATELSSKLLADHKRETEAAKKESEQRVAKATESLLGEVKGLSETVVRLNAQVDRTRETADTVLRALATPGGAGQYAEIGLENTLKKFGLERDRDFFMQAQVEGSRLRPDALVLLPGDTVLVVDAKASKFLLDMAAAQGAEEEAQATASLVRTMNGHLKALAEKSYAAAIREGYHGAGRPNDIRAILSLMYLPNEGALEKLRAADPDFFARAARLGITPVGPAGLEGLLAFAKVRIDMELQAENQERIVEGTAVLLDRIGIVLEYAQRVGRGLKSASDNYVKFAGSVNGRLLPGVQGLVKLGVRPNRHKPLPHAINAFQVTELETVATIDGEVESLDETKALAGPDDTPDEQDAAE